MNSKSLQLWAACIAVVSAAGCGPSSAQATDGRIAFLAHAPQAPIHPGQTSLGLASERDGFLFVPRDTTDHRGVPLLILLHGATQRAVLFQRLLPAADSAGVAILAPDSRGITWDAVRADFGPDVEFLRRAITIAFDRARIDPCRVVLGGFSDGASYALSLGIRNASTIHGIVALSPGFIIPAPQPERLPVFLRHGTRDEILPINSTSRQLVALLRDAGFAVDYQEFDGPHMVRPDDARAALQWTRSRSCGA
ncbi:MAG TPA: alpha/beta fold hydrolase [Gemmatimonadaceae bacterium]|nr:alpha/beta fold hydrolase [Gemmatimonadaceae bacterium]